MSGLRLTLLQSDICMYTQYRNIRNSTQILENLRNAVVGFFGLRNKFVNVQGNKKRSTQNVFKLRNRKKNARIMFYM